ncbi:MAG TPA: hypothetical protein VFV55_01355 [Usitatibacteraceae bacterium]|nr:hypothetical protein [Usitatibacteraceae bacterium]
MVLVEMKKFGFRIRTRGGSVVDNLTIQGRDRDEAERKLRQVYHHCVILEARELRESAPVDGSDFEGVINLIADEGSRDGG